MEIELDETKYEVALGFGNIMQIQSIAAQSISPSEAEELAAKYSNAEITELEEAQDAELLMRNAALVPQVITLVIRKVNGKEIANKDKFVNEKLNPSHGLELFTQIMAHVNELIVPKE